MPVLEGLFLTQADGPDSGLAEYGRRDHVVIHRAVLLRLEQTARHGHAFCECNRRQLHTANDVANGQNRRFIGLVQVIDVNEAALVEFDARGFQTKVVKHRPAPRRIEHAIGFKHTTVF